MLRSITIIFFGVLWLSIALSIHPIKAQNKRQGCEVVVYWDGNYTGEAWRTADDQPNVGPHWNKQISSIIAISGIWDFYRDGNYRGEVLTLPPGAYASIGEHWNDQISSFRCVRPTN
jgi:hypothetical protein